MFDVVVYGATASGVMAAIAAATTGCRVALLEPGRHVGGMVSGGLGWTDRGVEDVIGGLARTFYSRVGARYGVGPWELPGPEPRVAESIFRAWLREAAVEVAFGSRLETVGRQGRSIDRIVTAAGTTFRGRVFIDATYEGDLLAGAGVSHAIGRESVSLYGESWAGRQPIRPDPHQFTVPVSPCVDGPRGSLLPLIHDRPMVPEGDGDGGVQSCGYRLCLTDRADNRVPFPRPDDYDPVRYELLRRFLVATAPELRADDLFTLRARLPNDKVDANSKGPISTNLPDGSSWAYPDADLRQRRAIQEHHLRYTQGLMYFLANDPGVPEPIRREMSRWGLCADEFADTDHWPHQLYVRDARRMVGEYVLTQHDLDRTRTHYDAVAMGSYHIDIREVQRVWMPVSRFGILSPETFNEGYLSVPVQPYPVPYRSLLPRYAECDNLIVPLCLSASHVAFASLRMEPQYMMLGHAAGAAAGLAVRDGRTVHQVDIPALQRALVSQGQILELD